MSSLKCFIPLTSRILLKNSLNTTRYYSSTAVGSAGDDKAQKISNAMKSYLQRAQSHDKFMNEEIAEYEIGKRHLANIMGEDVDNFHQEDIDRAIRYLLPSGLYDKKARPAMKHPSKTIPKRKAAEFGEDGRPFNHLFYTGKSNFYQLMHDINAKIESLDENIDKDRRIGLIHNHKSTLNLAGSEWASMSNLSENMNEPLKEKDYFAFIKLMEKLILHDYAFMEKQFINTYRVNLQSESLLESIESLKHDSTGRGYQIAHGERKESHSEIIIRENGTGEITIDGKSLYKRFPNVQDREQIIFPLHFCGLMTSVDVEASIVRTGLLAGSSSDAGSIRHGISLALQSFVDEIMIERLRMAGLLTKDPRKLERQKPGQSGARRKFTWKKR